MLSFRILLLFIGGCLAAVSLRGAPPARASEVARFRESVRRVLSKREARGADWGILVADQRTGRTLYAHDASRFFTPASNAKLFTSSLALAVLGPDYRWHTTLETSGHVAADGTLEGNLVLVGRGDPNLSNRVFPYNGVKEQTDGPPEVVIANLVAQLAAKGIKRIHGDAVADDSYFTYERYPPGWSVDDMTADYGAPVSAIVIDDNTMEIDVTPGARPGDPTTIQVLPFAAFYHFRNDVTTAAAGAPAQVSIAREPDSLDVTLTGQVPVGEPPSQEYLAIEQPARYAAALLKHLLVAQGIAVTGDTRVEHLLPDQTPGKTPARQVLAEHVSPPLGEALRYILKVSQNLHAECLLRTVAHVRTGVGSLQNGLALEQEFLTQLGIEKDVVFFDGSGLSRYDLVTPRAVVKLLRWDARQSWWPVLYNALPVAGQDGTLQDRMGGTPAEGRVVAKTGTLEHDNSLSGYVTTLSGRRLVFSMFVNNDPPHAHLTPFMDKIAEAMVEDFGRGRPRRRANRNRRGATRTAPNRVH